MNNYSDLQSKSPEVCDEEDNIDTIENIIKKRKK